MATEVIDGDDLFVVLWDGCDLVVETTADFELRHWPNSGDNLKSMELVVEDRLCVGDMEHFSAMHFRFYATLEPW